MCTPTSKFLFFRIRNEIASSKSLASSGSMVNVVIFRKSFLAEISSFEISSFIFFACFSMAFENLNGNPNSAMMECISASWFPAGPSISMISPTGFLSPVGHSTILTITLSLFFAPFLSPEGLMKISWCIFLKSGTTNP